ncbi:MAG: hypothetical protein A2Y10_08440 [Planctomycetes bacterium GWF2_41_51]|nr:MAG: hypothetical protein A2Y10_08440 [Planctomycetes bacterium GWF2_41_51]HBG27065.1 NAD-dependent dehydratase [Phycisphaerales bacterium]
MSRQETCIEGLGVSEWFKIGQYGRVEKVLNELRAISIKHIRAAFSYEDWHQQDGSQWFEWLFSNLSKNFELLPCFVFNPGSKIYNMQEFADFIKLMIQKFGLHFQWFELLNSQNSRICSDYKTFNNLIKEVAAEAKINHKKILVGGISPCDIEILDLFSSDLVNDIDAIGIRDFPGNYGWINWDNSINKVRKVFEENKINLQIWITETGFSTWGRDEFGQITNFIDFLKVHVDRRYWYSAEDLTNELFNKNEDVEEKRQYHFGLIKNDGNPKLIYRIWKQQGLQGLQSISSYNGFTSQSFGESRKLAMITGGAGFIGTNLADKLLSSGKSVIIFDNLSRHGTEHNIKWLKQKYPDKIKIKFADIRNKYALRDVLNCVDQVFHLAAQVAVTSSIIDPVEDFSVNINGTLNLLEEIRRMKNRPSLLFTSTNKVYGRLDDINFVQTNSRYEPVNTDIKNNGIGENRHLDFHSPYGCSKGSADQYVLDYCRIYDLSNVIFRMSCIYGPHQFGTEDQGWVAYFLIQAINNKNITIFGNGKQVRDILFVDDLTQAMTLAMKNIDVVKGKVFNIGGGPDNTISILEFLEEIKKLNIQMPDINYGQWRSGDQKYYVSNINLFKSLTGWQPKVTSRQGIKKLFEWLNDKHYKIINEKIHEYTAI